MKLKASELRELSFEELLDELDDAKEEYFNLRFQLTSGQLEDTNRLRMTRRNIARILTVIGERELKDDE